MTAGRSRYIHPEELGETPDDVLYFERRLKEKGYLRIAGIDEAGRGALCGPVVAAAVVLPEGRTIRGVTDSKQLSPAVREALYGEVRNVAAAVGIGLEQAGVIDRINILNATRAAMVRAVSRVDPRPDCLIVDAVRLDMLDIPQLPLVKGDSLSHSVSAASIVAKVVRDRIMTALARRFPDYNLAANKGYGTPDHLDALKRLGPTPIHRRTFHRVCDCFELF